MARTKRYHAPGALYHVMLRGNNGHNIFFSETDKYSFSYLLQEGTERYARCSDTHNLIEKAVAKAQEIAGLQA